MDQKNPDQEKGYFDLRDLFFYVLKHWKILVMFLMIGILLGAAYSYYVMNQNSLEGKKKKLQQLINSQSARENLDEEKVLQYKELQDAYQKVKEEGDSEERTAAYNALVKLEKTLNDNELLYYRIYYAGYTPRAGFSFKWPVVFAVLLTAFGVLLLIVRFLADQHVKNENEIRTCYGLNILSIQRDPVRKKNKKKSLSQLFSKWEEKNKAPANSREYLKAVLQTIDISRGLLTGDANDESVVSLMNYISDADVRFIPSGSLSTDAGAQIKAKAAEGIIFVIRLWHTRRAVLQRDTEVIGNLDKPVLGAIVIR